MKKLRRAISWGYEAYCYQRDKPHGKKASRYHSTMIALSGAWLIAGQNYPRLNPFYWLLKYGNWKLSRKK